jgi:hypothetical protein
MKSATLVRTKRVAPVVFAFVLSPILLASCGGEGETTIEENTVEETTVEETTMESTEEEGIVPPTPTPDPTPTPSPTPPGAVEVNCGIGAMGILKCANAADTPYYCSGSSSAVGSPYWCTDPLGQRYDCEVVVSRMGGFTLSCTRQLQ